MSRELPLRTRKVPGCWDPGSVFVPSAGDNRAGARPPGSRCGTAPQPATRSSWTRRGGRTQVSPRSRELRTLGGSPAARTALLYTQSRAPGSGSGRSGARDPTASAILAARSTRIRWAWLEAKPRLCTVHLPRARHTLLISPLRRKRILGFLISDQRVRAREVTPFDTPF